MFLQLSATQRDHRNRHHEAIVKNISQVIQPEITIVFPSRQLLQREDLCVECRESSGTEQFDHIDEAGEDHNSEQGSDEVFSLEDPSDPGVESGLGGFGNAQ